MAIIQIRCDESTKATFDSNVKKYGFKKAEDYLKKSMNIFDEVEYSNNGGTVINEHLLNSMSSITRDSELRLGNRLSKLVYEVAINQAVILKILQNDKLYLPDEVKEIRTEASRMMQEKNHILNYNDLKE